jgi:multiple sugar transport system permease protein
MSDTRVLTLKDKVRDGVLIALLIVLLLVVLLPMFWMVLTAFKVKGTAFQLEFLPETTLYQPELDQPALKLPSVGPDEWYLYAEKEAPEATTMQLLVAVEESDEEIVFPMTRFSGGTWAATVGPLPQSRINYAFIINGERETIAEDQRDERAYDPAKEVTLTVSTSPSALVYRRGDRLEAMVRGTSDSSYELLLDETTSIPLKAGGDGIFTAEVPSLAGSPATFRLKEQRGFSTAVAEKYTLANFREILTSDTFNFGRYFLNSLVVATGAGLLTVFICTLAGYAFAVKRFHYREQLFGLLLLSMLVPGMIYMVPQFSITLNLGLMNTYAGMIVPHLANVFGLFLLRQYIGQIPRDLFAAAEVDGAREHQVFSNVVIPVCLPIMVTLFLLVFVGQWSNFLWQLIINTGTSDVLTLPVGLQQFKGQNANDWEKIMAGACFSILPIAALFLSMQKYFLEGLTAGSVKE